MGIFSSKKYNDGLKDGAAPFKDILKEIADGKKDLQELSQILSKRKYKKLLNIYFSDHPVKIKIIKGDKADLLSDDLRKLLSQRRFDVSISSYQDYQIKGSQGAHYVIFIGNPEKITNAKHVYDDAYGCTILKKDNLFFVMQYEEYYKFTDQEEFLKYYEKTVAPITENEKLNQALQKKGLIEEHSKSEKFLDKISEDMDKNLFIAGMELVGVLTSLPLCLGDVAVHAVSSGLKKDKADKDITIQAQKQILLIKTMEIMENERYKFYKGR